MLVWQQPSARPHSTPFSIDPSIPCLHTRACLLLYLTRSKALIKTRTVEEAAPGASLQGACQLDLIEGMDLAQLELVPPIELREALPIGAHVRHA